MNHQTQATEFHFTIGITVRGVCESEPVQAYVVDAVQELAHSRLFLSGRIKAGVVSEHDNDHGRVVTTTTVTRERRPASGSSLPPHQQRVLAEKAELDDRLAKLQAFSLNPIFYGLPTDEQDRLQKQAVAMQAYSEVLGERITAF